jgi:hypothetical protein
MAVHENFPHERIIGSKAREVSCMKRFSAAMLAAILLLSIALPCALADNGTATEPLLSMLTHNAPTTGIMLPEVFSPYQTTYLLTVASWVSRIRFTPVCPDNTVIIRVNGAIVVSGAQSQIIELSDKPQAVNIVLTALDMSQTTYTVYLQRRPSEKRTRVSSGYIDSLYTSGGKNYISANLVTVTYTANTNLSTFFDDTFYLYKYACSPNCIFYYGTLGTAYRAVDFATFSANYTAYGSQLYRFVYIEDEIVAVLPYDTD